MKVRTYGEHQILLVERFIKNKAPHLHLFLIYHGLNKINTGDIHGDSELKINTTESFLRDNGVEFYENLSNAINNKNNDNLIIRHLEDKDVERYGEWVDMEDYHTGWFFIISKELVDKILLLGELEN